MSLALESETADGGAPKDIVLDLVLPRLPWDDDAEGSEVSTRLAVYPDSAPVAFLRGLPLHTQCALATETARLVEGSQGETILYEVALWAQENAAQLAAAPSGDEVLALGPSIFATTPPALVPAEVADGDAPAPAPAPPPSVRAAVSSAPPAGTGAGLGTSVAAAKSTTGRNGSRQHHCNRSGRGNNSYWDISPSAAQARATQSEPSALIRAQRRRLPAANSKEEVLELLRNNQVILVCGGTGCGKTTQVPQFILEKAEEEGTGVKIVVAQPRRIAAMGVAQRVAEERGQPMGQSVGYMIRGETKVSVATQLLFCTTGVLLQRLRSDPTLGQVTHIVVDEVHERHLDADFLLAALRTIIPQRPQLRVVLMSATLDTVRFSSYFGDLPNAVAMGGNKSKAYPGGRTPMIDIPGFAHPVTEYFLDDVIDITGHIPRHMRGKGRYSKAAIDAAAEAAENGLEVDYDATAEEEESEATSVVPAGGFTAKKVKPPGGAEDAAAAMDYRHISTLIERVVEQQMHNNFGGSGGGGGGGKGGGKHDTVEGAILVFLPGVGEISRMCSELQRCSCSSHLFVVPLHGALPPAEQTKAFRNPPRGLTKVVVATNIAETSITIPDCTVVVDSGRAKETGFNAERSTPFLAEVWGAQDALRQRRGRAGRVRPGCCFRMFTRKVFDSLPAHTTPEICRSPLDQVVLTVKAFRGTGPPQKFLATFLDPPPPAAVASAIAALRALGALAPAPDGKGLHLSALGSHLATLPCSPRVGKMLVYGAVLGVLPPVLSIAAGLSLRSPFLSPREPAERASAEAAKRDLQKRSKCGRSDHTLLAAAFDEWDNAGGSSAQRRLCDDMSLSFVRMMELRQLRQQLSRAIQGLGFDTSDRANRFYKQPGVGTKRPGRSVAEWRVVSAVICAALYPNLMKIQRPVQRYHETAGGAVEADGEARELKFHIKVGAEDSAAVSTGTGSGGRGSGSGGGGGGGGRGGGGGGRGGGGFGSTDRVFVHPGSLNFKEAQYTSPWLVYNECVTTSRAFVRDTTEASPYALLLFGGTPKVEVASGKIVVTADGAEGADWVRFSAVPRIGVMVHALRQKLDELLASKIEAPDLAIDRDPAIVAMVALLVTEGLG